MKLFINIGCGPKSDFNPVPCFNMDGWREIRFDIDESVHPDVVGSMLDMEAVENESVDAVFSSHNIEHLYAHEVSIALKEFIRVLKPNGFLIVTCPDLQSVCALIADNKLTDMAYMSPIGPITPLDILYGHGESLRQGNSFMAHRCGFTKDVLTNALQNAGFTSSLVFARPDQFDLWGIASKKGLTQEELLNCLMGK